MVTFVDVIDNGFQGEEFVDTYETNFNYRLQVDGGFLQACRSNDPSACVSDGTTSIFMDSYQETQALYVCSNVQTQFNFLGQNVTLANTLSNPVTLSVVSQTLQSMSNFGKILVSAGSSYASGENGCSGTSTSYIVTFASFMGDVPLIRVHPGSSQEIVKGFAQFVDGIGDYSTVIQRPYFTDGAEVYVRVAAVNSVGYSPFSYSYQNPIVFYDAAPARPAGITVASYSDTELLVTWAVPPRNPGITNFSHYIIEYDTNPAFSSWCAQPTCSGLNVLPQGTLVPSLLNQTYLSYVIGYLVPGEQYYVRIQACYSTTFQYQVDVLCSPFTYMGFPHFPVAASPVDVSSPVAQATLTLLNSTSLAVDWIAPEVRGEGSNGSPLQNYTVTLASPVAEVQQLILQDSTGLFNYEFALSYGSPSSVSRCIAFSASASEIALKLSELANIDSVEVALVSSRSTSTALLYEITFTGSLQPNGNLITVRYPSSCNVSTAHSPSVSSTVLVAGYSPFVPEVFTIVTTSSTTALSGYFDVRFGYKGDMVRAANKADYSEVITVLAVAGQRTLTTNSDATHLLAPGVLMRINDQEVTVETIVGNVVTFFPYLTHAAASATLYTSESLVGTATVGTGTLSTTNYMTASYEVFEGDTLFVTFTLPGSHVVYSSAVVSVTSVSGLSPVTFVVGGLDSATFKDGSTVVVYKQKNEIVPFDASSDDLQAAMTAMAAIGSVEVARFGPSTVNGLTWSISFTSTYGSTQTCVSTSVAITTDSCLSVYKVSSSAPLVVSAAANAAYAAMVGTYLSDSFSGGRRAYFMVNGPFSIVYRLGQWQVFDGTSGTPLYSQSSPSFNPITALAGVASLSFAKSFAERNILFPAAASVTAANVQSSIAPSLVNIVVSQTVAGTVPEVQSVTITTSDGLIFGGYNLDFNASGIPVYFRPDESAQDFATKLESLPTVGSVNVSRVTITKPKTGAFMGYTWFVTFLSNEGDVPIMTVRKVPVLGMPIYGSNLVIAVNEVSPGSSNGQVVSFNNLVPGQQYSAQVYANNLVGVGVSTVTVQNAGTGVVPMSFNLWSEPSAPAIASAVARSANQLELQVVAPADVGGGKVEKYLVEYTTNVTAAFSVSTQTVSFRLFNNAGNDTLGYWRIGFQGLQSALLPWGASAAQVAAALNDFPYLEGVTVQASPVIAHYGQGYEYDITTTSEIGALVSSNFSSSTLFTVDTSQLTSGSLTAAFVVNFFERTPGSQNVPNNYAVQWVYTDCAKLRVGQYSEHQVLTVTSALADVYGTGSFRLSLGQSATTCIPLTFSTDTLQAALMNLPNVGNVFVEEHKRNSGSSANAIRDLHIFFEGLSEHLEWPYLKAVPQTGSSWDGIVLQSCSSFSLSSTSVTVTTVSDNIACADGVSDIQVVVLEAKGPATGYFYLYLNGYRTVSISSTAMAADVERAINSLPGIAGVSVSRYTHFDAPFSGYAWAVTFPVSYGNVQTFGVDDKYVFGSNAAVNIYPMVNISITADNNDISGHFQINVNEQATIPLSWSATDAVVLNALHNLTYVGKVAMIGLGVGEAGAYVSYSVSQVLPTGSMLCNTIVFSINATTNFAVGDSVYLGSTYLGYIAYMDVTTPSTTVVQLSASYHATGSSNIDVGVGPVRVSKTQLPGLASIVPLATVYNATYGSTLLVTYHTFSASPIFIQGVQYVISTSPAPALCTGYATVGYFCSTLLSPYVGPNVVQGNVALSVFDVWTQVYTTSDWSSSVNINDNIWIGYDELTVVNVNNNVLSVLGRDISTAYEGAVAFQSGNGYERAIIFKATLGDVSSVRVTLESDFKGTNVAVKVSRSDGILPGVVGLGSLAEVQTVTFRAPSAQASSAAVSATYEVWVGNDIAGFLTYGSSASTWKTTLESLLNVDRVTVTRSGDGSSPYCSFGYSYTISFWGNYGTENIPQVTLRTNTTKYGVEVSVDTVRQGLVAADFSSRYVSLAEETSYQLRVRAFNQGGVSAPSAPVIAQTALYGTLPGSVQSVVLGAYSNGSTLSLSYQPPQQTGGLPITSYVIESDLSKSFDPTSSSYNATVLAVTPEIQQIVTSFRSGDDVKTRGGTFNITFGCRTSEPLDFDISAYDLETALNFLIDTRMVAVAPVQVTRFTWNRGYKWLVTFKGVHGNVGLLQVDPAMLVGDEPDMQVTEVVAGTGDIVPGAYTNEVQTVRVQALSPVSGYFVLGMNGYETPQISFQESYTSFKQKLEYLPTVFAVHVKRDVLSTPKNLFCWTVTFSHMKGDVVQGAGNLPPLTVVASPSSLAPNTSVVVEVFEVVKGTHPLQVQLNDLQAGSTVFTRITAYNERGYSLQPVVASAVVMGQPPVVGGASVTIASGSALNISWVPGVAFSFASVPIYSPASLATAVVAASASSVDFMIDGYDVEIYSSDPVYEVQVLTTSSSGSLYEIQRLTIDSDAYNLAGYFKLEFMGEMTQNIIWNANADGEASIAQALASLSTCGPVSVSRQNSYRAIEGLKVNGTQWSTFVKVDKGSTSSLSIGDIVRISGQELTITSLPSNQISFAPVTLHAATMLGTVVYKWSYGYTWDVTFTSQIGDIPQLVPYTSDNWAGTNPVLKVTTMVHGVAPLSGTFRVGFRGTMSPPLEHDLSPDDMKAALEQLDTIGQVSVTRFPNGFGFDWRVTFLSELGNIDRMYVNDAGLAGPFARAEISAGRNGLLPNDYAHIFVSGAQSTSTVVDGLSMGIDYQIRVRARNAQGASYPLIAYPYYISPKTAPTPPFNATIFALSPTQLKVVWELPLLEGGSNVTQYRVEWDSSPGFANSHVINVLVSSLIDTTFCYDINLPPSSSNLPTYARVLAYNGYAWSAAGYPNPRYAVGVVGAPGAPTAVTATPTSNFGILVSWQPPSAMQCVYGGDGGSPISYYVLEWDTRSDFGSPASRVTIYGADTLSYDIGGRNMLTGVVDTILEANTSYYLRVTAFNAKGSSVAGYVQNNPINTQDRAPDPPQGISVSTASVTTLNVAWDHSPRDGGMTLEKYRVEYSTNKSFSYYDVIDLPIVPEVQTVVAESPVVIDTQAIRVLAAVTNER